MKKIDLKGQRFGRLLVVAEAKSRNKKTFWTCLCDCGKTVEVHAYNLKRGFTKSCGCLNDEMRRKRSTTHGKTNSRLYGIWSHMKGRCFCKTDAAFPSYGGRGISVCEEWRDSFETFQEWALANGYRDDLTIDRIDNDGNYEPSNCRWVSRKEQARNTRNNFVYKGKCLSEWCEEIGIDHALVLARLNRLGWPIEKAIFTPVRHFSHKKQESQDADAV